MFLRLKTFFGWVPSLAFAFSLSVHAGEIAPRHQEFLGETYREVDLFLESSRFESRRMRACLDLVSFGEGSWFRAHDRDPGDYEAVCESDLASMREEIRSRWSRMRIALTLSAPLYRAEHEYDDLASQMNVKAQHPFWGTARLSPLQGGERAQAISEYRAELERLKAEFRDAPRTRGVVLPSGPAEASHVRRGIESFRRHQKQEYLRLIQEVPVLVLLTSSAGGVRELGAALSLIEKNAQELLQELKSKGRTDPELYVDYLPIIAELVKERPEWKEVANDWYESVMKRKRRDLWTSRLVSLGLTIGSIFSGSGPVRAAVQVVGIAQDLYGAFADVKKLQKTQMLVLSTFLNQRHIADFNALTEMQREVILTAVSLPLSNGIPSVIQVRNH